MHDFEIRIQNRGNIRPAKRFVEDVAVVTPVRPKYYENALVGLSGTVQVWSSTNTLLFTGTFSGGSATETGGNNLIIAGFTTGGNTVAGVLKLGRLGWFGSSDTIVTPEPGTLGLLGTGLVGLAGIVRRKIRA